MARVPKTATQPRSMSLAATAQRTGGQDALTGYNVSWCTVMNIPLLFLLGLYDLRGVDTEDYYYLNIDIYRGSHCK